MVTLRELWRFPRGRGEPPTKSITRDSARSVAKYMRIGGIQHNDAAYLGSARRGAAQRPSGSCPKSAAILARDARILGRRSALLPPPRDGYVHAPRPCRPPRPSSGEIHEIHKSLPILLRLRADPPRRRPRVVLGGTSTFFFSKRDEHEAASKFSATARLKYPCCRRNVRQALSSKRRPSPPSRNSKCLLIRRRGRRHAHSSVVRTCGIRRRALGTHGTLGSRNETDTGLDGQAAGRLGR